MSPNRPFANESIEARVARLEEIADGLSVGYREDRIEARSDRKEIISRLDGLTQTLQSTGNAVASLALEKCGERLNEHEKTIAEMARTMVDRERRIASLESRIVLLEAADKEMAFWRRVLGGGALAAWKVAAVMLGSGAIGAALQRYLLH